MPSGPLTIQQHLYQLYPNIPQFANDPEECEIIRSYDLISKRFQGIYGHEPKLFIRSPATCAILGSASHVIQSPVASFNCLHNVVICISENGHQKLRINHYQTAVYGEKMLEVDSVKWKHDENNDEYSSLLIASLKAYSSLFNIHTLPGLDILIFDDFVQDNYLNWKEALCLGIAVAVHAITQPLNSVQALNFEFSKKYLNKINSLTHLVKPIDYSFTSSYGSIHVNELEKEFDIEIPQDLEFIIANSMTPMPKKMIKGKRENLRAAEILIGIEIIKTEIGAASELKKYLSCTTAELIETIEEYLPKEGLNSEKIEQLTEKSLIDTLKLLPFANNVIDENIIFKPYKRIKFYLEEELSLESLTPQNFVEKINKSHSNGIDLLEIGSEQIGDMIEIFKDLAKGWKIIGDGWGGNLLIVCESGMSRHILEELTKNFYMSPKNQVLLSDDIEQYIKIIGKPANGVGILDPSSEIWF